mmetsp:Transcript_40491/g.74874  ORF Transcript_40491/g.74874 Transcript_40491/m.74874 type:complete len:93 (+) Transcript_40491:355-633(+)
MAGGVSCVDEFLDQIGLRHHSQKITDCETDMSTLMDFDAQNLLDLGLPLDSTLIILARVAALKTFFLPKQQQLQLLQHSAIQTLGSETIEVT